MIILHPGKVFIVCITIALLLAGEERGKAAGSSPAESTESAAGQAYAYDDRGMAYLAKGRLSTAIAEFNRALAIDPVYAPALYHRAIARFAFAGPEAAGADFQRLTELDSQFAAGLIPGYSRDIAMNPSDSRAYALRAIAAFAPKGLDPQTVEQALNDFGQALEINPDSLFVYIYRAWLYVINNQPDKALADVERLLQLDPDVAAAYALKAVALRMKGLEEIGRVPRELQDKAMKATDDNMLASLNTALALDPEYVTAYEMRGLIQESRKQYDLATADYNKILELNPYNANAYKRRGNLYNIQEKYEQAIADYSRACELDPQDIINYLYRARIYEQIKNPEKALADYEQVIKISPAYASAYYRKAVLLHAGGRHTDAVNNLKLYLQYAKLNDPYMRSAKRMLYELEAGLK